MEWLEEIEDLIRDEGQCEDRYCAYCPLDPDCRQEDTDKRTVVKAAHMWYTYLLYKFGVKYE